MNLFSNRNIPLLIAIFAIIAYWVFSVATLESNPKLPETMSEFFLGIMKARFYIIVIIILLMAIQKDRIVDLGFSNKNVKKQIGTGLFSAFVLFFIINFGLLQLLNFINPETPGTNSIAHLISDVKNLPAFLFIGIFAGGFVEEFQRIFILTRFEHFKGKVGLIFALVVSSIIFGSHHLYQGVNGAIAAGTLGLIYGLLYLRKRSAIEVITSHAIYDVLSLLLVFFIYSL